MARPYTLQSYQRNPLPLLVGENGATGDIRYLQEELRRVEAAFADVTLMTPQPAIAAPKVLRDGMIRLARAPWRPIGGAVDRWVYWDAPTLAWLACNAH